MRTSDRSNVFSHQYLSMKQNPKIKRNAMHAYITYMIYADSSHNGNQVSKGRRIWLVGWHYLFGL
jgi:hypothetical protein